MPINRFLERNYMNMKTILLASVAAFTLSATAYAADPETYQTNTKIDKDSNGNYAEKDVTTKTDSAGTTTTFEKKASVDVDAKGNTDKSTTTKKVTDPAGLHNKQTVTTSNTEKVKDGVVKTSQEIKVDGKTVESKTETTPQQ